MMKLYAARLCTLSVVLMFNSLLLLGQVPSYYDGTDISQTGNSLKTELAALITQTHTTELSYTPGVWDALKQTDLDPDDPENVLLIYGYNDNDGNLQTDRTRDKDSNGGNTGDWNREHVFAKSLGNPNLGTSGPGSDAHHLRAADVSMNSQRGSLPFEDASGNARRISNSWYPGDEWKGDVARMVMYMYLRYGDRCLPSAVGVGSQNYNSDMMDVFLEWNAEDPVSQYELNRNDILETLQGNRNPFIDNPAFATSIWNGPQAEDRFGDTTPPPASEANVIINEIDADTPGTDAMEFVELYDGGTGNTSLDGMVLVLYNGSTDVSYAAFDLSGYSTNAEGYFVLGNEAVANVSVVFPGNTLQNGADAVALYSGSASDFPTGTAITTENLLDAIAYDTNDDDDAEILTLLNAGEPQVNEDELSDKDNHSLQRIPNGEGGVRNTSACTPAMPTPGTANNNGGTGKTGVLINEIDSDTPSTDVMEFIELYDGGTGNTSLDGLVVVLYNGSNDLSYAAFDLSGYSTNAEGYFVLGNEGVANVSLTFPGNTLQNGADAVALYSGTAADFPGSTPITTDNLIDAIIYDTNDADDPELLVLLNAGEPQVNEDGEGNKDNHSLQRIPNGEGGMRNTSTYAPAIPTPGTANGETEEPTGPVSIVEARSIPDGTTVTISGVLTVSYQFAGSAYIQDNTGAIAVFDQSVHGDSVFQVGDSITLTGTRSSFNNQVQIGPVSSVTRHGMANAPIVPAEIALSEMGSHPAELVRIVNVTFPTPGDLLFGNSNYMLSDSNGSGELRIDNDVESIVGLAQPDTCSEVVGVVGRFQDIYQLLPRMKADLPCAEEYTPGGDDLNIPKNKTLDVAAWNIEWFGDESNSPAAGSPDSDMIQKDSVKTILAAMDADVIAVEEISDDALFARMVGEMEGYDYVLSDYTSYPNDPGVKQKVGFIYKTSTVSPVETKPLLASIHPYYNGGDSSALTDYPDDPTRFFASGRLPFLMTADITIGDETEQVHFIVLHARANSSSGAQSRYDMRKYDVEVLKDSLDAMYADANLILLGDYNDDVDETVADVSTRITSYEAYVNDMTNYNVISSSLSDEGLRSYVFRENMIDHIMVSDELNDNFIDGSARVGYEFYDSDYTFTTSDHFPVSARFRIQASDEACASCKGDGMKICYQGKTRCLSRAMAEMLLEIGAECGPCKGAGKLVLSKVYIYPNPVIWDTNILLKSSESTTVSVLLYDRNGNLVYTDEKVIDKGKNRISLDLSNFRRGIYICKLVPAGGDGTVTKKILKL